MYAARPPEEGELGAEWCQLRLPEQPLQVQEHSFASAKVTTMDRQMARLIKASFKQGLAEGRNQAQLALPSS
eukprot:8906479-Prorocentrum_lima.AAC.1